MDNFATLIGYHGCERSLAMKVLLGEEELNPSTNDYDWLGEGIYFWANDAQRALQWAKTKKEPFVLGAVICCSNILDFTTQEARIATKKSYDSLYEIYEGNNIPLPKNKPVGKGDIDLKNRKLDCLVMNHLQKTSPFDAFIAPFWEGKAIYDGAMFKESTHIQIAVKNPKSILGYFISKELKLK